MKRLYQKERNMRFHARPISFKPPRLNGLSWRLIASHYENNYGGAVRRLNAMPTNWRPATPRLCRASA